jgi:hypothetical protein
MLVFPQLLTGAVAQFPIRKRITKRVVRNEMPGGHQITLADPDNSTVEWALTFDNITDEEVNALDEFFRQCEGPLRSFTFLDPTANLLCRSDDLSHSGWTKDPLLTVTTGTSDAFGGQFAATLRNAAPVTAGIEQRVSAPESFWYNFSAYIRGDGSQVTMKIDSYEQRFTAQPDWKRRFISSVGQQVAALVFRIEIEVGGSAEICGLQVEPQCGASKYKRTGAAGGVYRSAHFSDEQIEWRSTGPGRHSCAVRIRSNVNSL